MVKNCIKMAREDITHEEIGEKSNILHSLSNQFHNGTLTVIGRVSL